MNRNCRSSAILEGFTTRRFPLQSFSINYPTKNMMYSMTFWQAITIHFKVPVTVFNSARNPLLNTLTHNTEHQSITGSAVMLHGERNRYRGTAFATVSTRTNGTMISKAVRYCTVQRTRSGSPSSYRRIGEINGRLVVRWRVFVRGSSDAWQRIISTPAQDSTGAGPQTKISINLLSNPTLSYRVQSWCLTRCMWLCHRLHLIE